MLDIIPWAILRHGLQAAVSRPSAWQQDGGDSEESLGEDGRSEVDAFESCAALDSPGGESDSEDEDVDAGKGCHDHSNLRDVQQAQEGSAFGQLVAVGPFFGLFGCMDDGYCGRRRGELREVRKEARRAGFVEQRCSTGASQLEVRHCFEEAPKAPGKGSACKDGQQVVLGRYLFNSQDIIGSGGFSVVRRGVDLLTKRPVAIKMYSKLESRGEQPQHEDAGDEEEEEEDDDEDDETEELRKQFEDEVTSLLALHSMPLTISSRTESFAAEDGIGHEALKRLPPRKDLFVEIVDFSRPGDEGSFLVEGQSTPGHGARVSSTRRDRPGPACDGNCYLILELATETLEQYLARQTAPLAREEVQMLFKQVCEVITSLHACGFVHLDLKPSNLMRFPSGRFKLIDMDGIQVPGQSVPFCDVICTAKYCAPELAQVSLDDDEAEENTSLRISRYLDVYSLGLVGAELAFLRHPLEVAWQSLAREEKGFYRFLCEPDFVVDLPCVPNACPEFLELLQSMLCAKPSDRISMPEVLAHPYFQKDVAKRAIACPQIPQVCHENPRRWSTAVAPPMRSHAHALPYARGGA